LLRFFLRLYPIHRRLNGGLLLQFLGIIASLGFGGTQRVPLRALQLFPLYSGQAIFVAYSRLIGSDLRAFLRDTLTLGVTIILD
jgi:hypothetical protein